MFENLFKWGFEQPLFLLLIVPWLLILLWKKNGGYWQDKSQSGFLFPLTNADRNTSETVWSRVFYRKKWFLDLAILMLILVLARPGNFSEEMTIEGEGVDIMIAIDLSSSMLATDFYPDRLEAAKELLADFIDSRPVDRIGIVAFAGESFTLSPLTTDHSMLKQLIPELHCGMIADGTAIGMGLATALARMRDTPPESGLVILLTDGVNNTGTIEPMTAARMAEQMGITLYSIGVGSEGMARAPIRRNIDGSLVFGNVRVEIDEALLREMSALTGGRYFRADREETLEEIYNLINELEVSEITAESVRYFRSWYRLPMGLALFFCFLYLIPDVVLKKFP
ncbi:MAG: VWA domain-containing protein [Saprospirales bacterium]|nr:MAG: VWA domain-containing protein [Saprospirales bacterium]